VQQVGNLAGLRTRPDLLGDESQYPQVGLFELRLVSGRHGIRAEMLGEGGRPGPHLAQVYPERAGHIDQLCHVVPAPFARRHPRGDSRRSDEVR